MNPRPLSCAAPAAFAAAAVAALAVSACALEPRAEPPRTLPSGLVFELLRPGAGPHPGAGDTVRVHYRGTFADGREFDSSLARGTPAEFPLSRVIQCWTEGVQLMQVGAKARFTCPPAIAYGSRGAGSTIPPDTTLHFEVELLGIAGR